MEICLELTLAIAKLTPHSLKRQDNGTNGNQLDLNGAKMHDMYITKISNVCHQQSFGKDLKLGKVKPPEAGCGV